MVHTMEPRTRPTLGWQNGWLKRRRVLRSSLQQVPREVGEVALAATEGLPEPIVEQSIALTAMWAGQQQTALIGFNGGHGMGGLNR
jgi:hypothetical protein